MEHIHIKTASVNEKELEIYQLAQVPEICGVSRRRLIAFFRRRLRATSSHNELDNSQSSCSSLLGRYRGRVMVYDQPTPVAIPVDKAKS
jgi:hypothetical protein